MAFNIDNFVIDHVIRGTAFDLNTEEVLFSISQITNPSLSCSSENTEKTDALGTVIARFYRAKSAEFSAENALIDLSMMAAQMGTSKKVAAEGAKIEAPAFETITVVSGETTYTLKHAPKGEINAIYALKGDSTLGTKYTKGTDADTDKFAISGKVVTLPTGLTAGTQLYVMYTYESASAVEVVNSAVEFPTAMKWVMEVLGCDVCDQSTKIYAYVIFPNAKLSPDVSITFDTESTHGFSMTAQQDYCDAEKRLFSIVIPDSDEE